ncbi:MAG TPA: hypothetical protein VNU68_06320 [Verrucomicrobiae bacterium]|nr:hypothetical protein [Verrucomicrobiae bacterium]
MDNVSLAHHLGSFQNPAFVTDQPALRGKGIGGKGIGAPSHGGSSKLWIRANGTSGCMVLLNCRSCPGVSHKFDMKRDRILGVCGGLAALVVGTVLCVSHQSEPLCKGKPLSSWLGDLRSSRTQTAAVQAICQMGTNAVPFLVRELQATDSGLKSKILRLAQKQHL